MDMALFVTRLRDLNESALFLQLFDRLTTNITHTGTKTTHKLVNCFPGFTFERNTTDNTFRDIFARSLLKITVTTSFFHGIYRAHTAINLIATPLIQDCLPRALLSSCQHTAHHNRISTSSYSLNHITGKFDPAISNQTTVIFPTSLDRIHNGRYLWHSYPSNNPGCTYRSRTNPYFDRINTSLDQ